jgi:CHAT domain-containing protein
LFRSANPDTPPSHELPRLPQTAAELEALRRLAGKRPIRVLSGAGATRESLLAARELGTASLLHLATHGEASEYEQRQAGLWLAVGEDGEPGWLSVDDVLGLRLQADLVTLSACQTGLGRVAKGEGVLGLSRAFLVAGAGTVMVSLWRVNDQSTATLMEAFYQGLLNRKQTAPQALAAAKRRMLASSETRAPFHWAPFVLSGRPPTR